MITISLNPGWEGPGQFAAFFLKAACPSYGLWIVRNSDEIKFVLMKQLPTCTLSHPPYTNLSSTPLVSRQATLDISPEALLQWPLIGAGPHLTEGLILFQG